VRYSWLAAAAVAAGCGVAAAQRAAPPACGGARAPSQLGAIHFLSPELGVGLTTPRPRCAAMLAISRDSGRHWTAEGSGLPGAGGIEQLVATSTSRAWAAVGADRLMSTTDGGATWTPDTPRGSVMALALAGRTLWTLDCVSGPDYSCVSVLLRRDLPNGAWTISSPKLAPNPSPELAPAGGSGVVISAAGSLVIVSGRGQRSTTLSDPWWMGRLCQAAAFAAVGRSWWLLCLGAAAAGSSEKALLGTTDGGRIWTAVSQVTSLTAPPRPGEITLEEPAALAAGPPRRLWLAALNNLFESEDGGARWIRVPGPDPQGSPVRFDVLSSTHAWLLTPGQGLWRTTDGRHWGAL
jgi:photosystem II stability/assembly factor-like uncharacterized protein